MTSRTPPASLGQGRGGYPRKTSSIVVARRPRFILQNWNTVDQTAHDPPDGRTFRFRQPDDIFQLRVRLIDVSPAIWRRLLVPQDVPLPRLHHILQATMGWTDRHLHVFKVGDVRLGEPDEEYPPGPIDYRGITLNQIVRYKGSTCTYEYDLGDSWEHLIEVEEELPLESVGEALPRCVAGERACPPEDCGGPPGYASLVDALLDPDHPEHRDYRVWAGPRFQPDAFDIERVNRRLARFAPRRRRSPPSVRKRSG